MSNATWCQTSQTERQTKMAKLGLPKQFNFTQQAESPVWSHQFDRFWVASKLDKESSEVQVNFLLYLMGKEAEPIYKSFVYAGDNEQLIVD